MPVAALASTVASTPAGTGAAALAPLALAVPIIVACLLLAVGRYLPRVVVDAIASATAAASVAIDTLLLVRTGSGRVVTWAGGWPPTGGKGVGIVLVADPVGAGLALLAAALTLCALVFSWRYLEAAEAHFHALLLLFLAGMTGFALTGDLFEMFVFFELMGAAAYALTGFKIEDASSLQGALNFGIVNSFGAYVSLMGVTVLYARTGQLGLAQLSVHLTGRPPDGLVVAALALVSCGFLVKAAMVPFHFWTADAEAVAPSPVCALFSGVMVALGVYGAARLYWVVFSGTVPGADVRRTLLVFGTLTALVGATMCFSQRHLKRLLAYSTIAHVGLFLLGLATLTPDGAAGTAVYVVGHAGVKSALFLAVGILLNRFGSVDEAALHGRGRSLRLVGVLVAVGGLALAGLPPFGTALGKSLGEDAVAADGATWAVAVFVVTSAATGGAVLRAAGRIFLGLGPPPPQAKRPDETRGDEEPDVEGGLTRVPATMLAPIGALLAVSLAVGVVPGTAGLFAGAAERFLDRPGYVGQALSLAAPTVLSPVPDAHWTAAGVALGLLSTGLAVLAAVLAIWRHRIPQVVARLVRPVEPPLRAVRALHSGHVGDYIAWLLLGLAGLAALLGPPR